MSLKRFSLRSIAFRPGRAILTVLSIVIGVMAVMGVNVTTATTRVAYKQMFGLVTGRAALEISTEGDGVFSDSILEQVSKVPGIKAAAPVFQRVTALYFGDKRVQVQLVGVDPVLDSSIRQYTIKAGHALEDGNEILIDEVFAKALKLNLEDEPKLRMGLSNLPQVKIAGFMEPKSTNSLREAGVVLMPLKAAQKGFGVKGKLTTIQLVVDEESDVKKVKASIAPLLPTGVQVREPVTGSQSMDETLNSSEKGLQFATYFTLVLAVFIILNTFLMNISERRRQLSILRAIGATKWQIMKSIIIESLAMGAIGTVLGIFCGLGAAYLLNIVLAKVLGIPLPSLRVTPYPFVVAILVGVVTSIIGAVWPAYRAGKVSPLEGLGRVSSADLGKSPITLPLLGIALIIFSTLYLYLSIQGVVPDKMPVNFTILGWTYAEVIDFSFFAGGGMIIGIVMIYPIILGPFADFVVALLRRVVGVEASLARQQIVRHLTRSSLTAGVLFVAGSAGLGLAYSILDNVANVNSWSKKAIVGDFFIRVMMPDLVSGTTAHLPDELGEELRKMTDIETLEAASFVRGRSGETNFLVIGREFPENRAFALDLVKGDMKTLREDLANGQIIVGSVLAARRKLDIGDVMDIETTEGSRPMRICAITNDYLGGGVSAYVLRSVGMKFLGMEGADVYIAHCKPEKTAALHAELDKLCTKYEVLLHTSGEIHGQVSEKTKGVDGFLWVLITLMFIVASFGMVNTLTMNVLEQTREIGMLRIIAMTKAQVRRTIMTQALIIATAGLLPGVTFGVVLALMMNVVIPEELGHTIEFGFHPYLVLLTTVGGFMVVGLAAFVPAMRAANLDIVQALHYE